MTGRTPIRRNSAAAYGAAVIITMAAIGVRLAFIEQFQGYPFVTIFPAVILSTFIGGVGPGILAGLLGGAGAWYYFVPYVESFRLATTSDLVGVLIFGTVSGFMIWALGALNTLLEREQEIRVRFAAALEEKDALVRERELLLTEIRHRVGNNLQQITGLLLLHARRIAEPAAKEAFESARARVNIFAEVHQSLYRTGSDTVDLSAALTKLVTHLVSAHRPVGIACQVEAAPEFLWGPDKAVPVIMVVHELVCNAIEHGFGEEGTGMIAVALRRTPARLVQLTVADDGAGLPPGVDPEHGDSLGLSIVRAFARQLNGTFGLQPGDSGRGTIGELVFDDGSRQSRSKDGPETSRRAA